MKQQRIGLGERRATRTIASAVPRAFVMDCGVRMTRAPSTPSSLITAERAVFVTVGRGVSDDVHGVVDVGRRGEVARQLVDRLLLEFRQFQVGGDGHVGRQDPRTAGVGHDGHPFAAGDLPLRLAEGALVLVGKGIGEIEELGDGVGPDDPRLFEDGVVNRLRPGEGAGVGGGRLGAGAGPSRLDDRSPVWDGGRR